jgi:L-fucose mutarotase
MLKTQLIHPEILHALGRAGHGSKVLLADANYPASTKLGPNADLVHLNLAPGMVSLTEILRLLTATIPIEAAEVMTPDSGPEPEIFSEFRELLKEATTFDRSEVELTKHGRFEFYDIAEAPDVALTIQTGEQRIYANLLLTIGVRL